VPIHQEEGEPPCLRLVQQVALIPTGPGWAWHFQLVLPALVALEFALLLQQVPVDQDLVVAPCSLPIEVEVGVAVERFVEGPAALQPDHRSSQF